MLSSLAVPILLIFPGSIIISKLLKRGVLDRVSIIAGSIFWFAILIIPSTIIASLTLYVNYYFYAFWIGSLVTLVSYLITVTGKLKEKHLHIYHVNLPITTFIIAESIFLALLTLYHPIYNEYDAITYYLPLAEGVIKTGGLFYNPYYLSDNFVARPPLVPLLYASTYLFGEQGFRSIPLAFSILTLLTVYSIAKEIFEGKTAIPLVSTAILSSLPVVILVLSKYSLYLEVGLTFYTSATFLFAVMALKYDKMYQFLFTGLAVGLSLMTKETGYVAFLIAWCVLSLKIRSNTVSVITSISPTVALFFFFYVYDAVAGLPLFYLIYRQLSATSLIIALTSFIITYRRKQKKVPLYWNHKVSKVGNLPYGLLLFLTISIFVGLFVYLRNYLVFHTPSSLWFIPEKLPYFYPSPKFEVSAISFFRWDTLFTSVALGGMYFSAKIIGLIHIFRRKDNLAVLLLMWGVLLTLNWAYFYHCQFAGNMARELLTFAPLLSILIAYGLYEMFNSLKGYPEYYTLYASVLCSLVLWFATSFQLNYWKYNGLLIAYYEKQPLIDVWQLSLSIGMIVITALPFTKLLCRFEKSLKSEV